jgi:hypothetical protein
MTRPTVIKPSLDEFEALLEIMSPELAADGARASAFA